MKNLDFYPCGHPRTKENTKHRAFGPICRECNNKHNRNRYARESKAERYERSRVRYLPIQLEATRRKLAMLENEARRLGLTDLLASPPERQP